LLAESKEQEEKLQRQVDDERLRQQEVLEKAGGGVDNIMKPSYALDKRLNVFRECNVPTDTLFLPLGWDETPESNVKHYRKYYPMELEKVKEVMPVETPFQTYELKEDKAEVLPRVSSHSEPKRLTRVEKCQMSKLLVSSRE